MAEVAIITGGASGIGAALGAELVGRGAHVVLADVDAQEAAARAELLTRQGPGSAVGVPLDVRDREAVAGLVRDVHATHGRLDYLFNNAGIGIGGEPEELTLDHWDRIIDVNLRGVLYGCHAAYPVMKQQGHGHIVNTASLAGLTPSPGWLAPYSTTKFAVVGLSLALRAAGEDHGVRVSAVCPGFVDTPILDKRGPADLPVPPTAARAELRAVLAQQRVPVYAADRLAVDILAGLARNEAVIAAPRSARAAWWLWRVAPAAALGIARRLTRQYREVAAEPEV